MRVITVSPMSQANLLEGLVIYFTYQSNQVMDVICLKLHFLMHFPPATTRHSRNVFEIPQGGVFLALVAVCRRMPEGH